MTKPTIKCTMNMHWHTKPSAVYIMDSFKAYVPLQLLVPPPNVWKWKQAISTAILPAVQALLSILLVSEPGHQFLWLSY